MTFNLRTTEVEVIDHNKAAVEFHVKYGGTPFLIVSKNLHIFVHKFY